MIISDFCRDICLLFFKFLFAAFQSLYAKAINEIHEIVKSEQKGISIIRAIQVGTLERELPPTPKTIPTIDNNKNTHDMHKSMVTSFRCFDCPLRSFFNIIYTTDD